MYTSLCGTALYRWILDSQWLKMKTLAINEQVPWGFLLLCSRWLDTRVSSTYQLDHRLISFLSTRTTPVHRYVTQRVSLLYRLYSLVQCTLVSCGSFMGWRVESGGSGMVWHPVPTAARRTLSTSWTGPLLWCPTLMGKWNLDSQRGRRCVGTCTECVFVSMGTCDQ